MKDKLSLVYKNRKLKITFGDKELPLEAIIDPATIILSDSELPTLRFEMILDYIEIDDMEATGKIVTLEQIREDNKDE